MAEIESWGYYKQLYANKMDNLEEVEKFSERYNFLILNREELEDINITHKQWIWNYNQKSSNIQKSRTKWFHRWILSNIWRRANTHLSQTLPKNCRGRNTSKLILQSQHPVISKQTQILQKKKIRNQYSWWTWTQKSSTKSNIQ